MEKPCEAVAMRREKCREYYRLHREEILARKKRYYQENKERIGEYHKGRRNERNATRRKRYADHKEQEIEKIYFRRKKYYGSASVKVLNALVAGKIKKYPCEVCGAEPAEAHHDDYNRPLDVRWLCKQHHTEWHKKNKPKYMEDT